MHFELQFLHCFLQVYRKKCTKMAIKTSRTSIFLSRWSSRWPRCTRIASLRWSISRWMCASCSTQKTLSTLSSTRALLIQFFVAMDLAQMPLQCYLRFIAFSAQMVSTFAYHTARLSSECATSSLRTLTGRSRITSSPSLRSLRRAWWALSSKMTAISTGYTSWESRQLLERERAWSKLLVPTKHHKRRRLRVYNIKRRIQVQINLSEKS